MADQQEARKLLRQYLNPAIFGPNTDAILDALSMPAGILLTNAKAINDQLYIVSAVGKYLDILYANKDFIRPSDLGIDDDVFREIGIEVTNRKQVRDLINKILETIYGQEYTRGQALSENVEPYSFIDGDTLNLMIERS